MEVIKLLENNITIEDCVDEETLRKVRFLMKSLIIFYTIIPAFIWVLSFINELLVYIIPNLINSGSILLFKLLGFSMNTIEMSSHVCLSIITGVILLGIVFMEYRYIKTIFDKVKPKYNLPKYIETLTYLLMTTYLIKMIIVFICFVMNINALVVIFNTVSIVFSILVMLVVTVVYCTYDLKKK